MVRNDSDDSKVVGKTKMVRLCMCDVLVYSDEMMSWFWRSKLAVILKWGKL